MLLTMPDPVRLLLLLSAAIELRGAPFFGWIHDLSGHDPLYITPVLMGITMLWQQQMTPSSADPMQQKMLMLMPVMLHRDVPVGAERPRALLVQQQPLAIGQQYVTNRMIGPPQVRQVRPAAERRARRAGEDRAGRREWSDGRGSRRRRSWASSGEVARRMGLTLERRRRGGRRQRAGSTLSGDGAEPAPATEGRGPRRAAAHRQHGIPARCPGRTALSSSTPGLPQDKDAELRQMATFLIGKAKTTGAPQEIGPLNPYARRIVHLAVSEDPDVTSESVGDAFLKTVIISRSNAAATSRRRPRVFHVRHRRHHRGHRHAAGRGGDRRRAPVRRRRPARRLPLARPHGPLDPRRASFGRVVRRRGPGARGRRGDRHVVSGAGVLHGRGRRRDQCARQSGAAQRDRRRSQCSGRAPGASRANSRCAPFCTGAST